jgi:hypothetical protein
MSELGRDAAEAELHAPMLIDQTLEAVSLLEAQRGKSAPLGRCFFAKPSGA